MTVVVFLDLAPRRLVEPLHPRGQVLEEEHHQEYAVLDRPGQGRDRGCKLALPLGMTGLVTREVENGPVSDLRDLDEIEEHLASVGGTRELRWPVSLDLVLHRHEDTRQVLQSAEGKRDVLRPGIPAV